MTAYLEKGNCAHLQVMGERFSVKVLAVAEDTIGVTFSGARYPVEGTGAELRFRDNGGMVSYHTQVVVAPRRNGDGMILQRVSSAFPHRHRSAWRVPMNTMVEMASQNGRPACAVQVHNVSADGALIESPVSLQLDERVDLRLPLGNGPLHNITARVIRFQPLNVTASGAQQVGVRFVDVSKSLRRALTVYIWQRLRDFYPEEISALFPGSRSDRRRRKEEARIEGYPSPHLP